MFIEGKIYIKAGDGGNGIVASEGKIRTARWPNGGDEVRWRCNILVDSNLTTLMDFRYKVHYKAKEGNTAKAQTRRGEMQMI